MDLKVDMTNSKTLSVSLEALRVLDEAKYHVAMKKFLCGLQPAQYVCINETDPASYHHYGLNFPLYTHFTSPIRRYADLLVHRLCTLSLEYKEEARGMLDNMDYSEYAMQCTEKALAAKRAGTQCVRVRILYFYLFIVLVIPLLATISIKMQSI